MELARTVGVHEPFRVVRRLQLRIIFGVAVFATEGRIDLGVTDQAIGHLGQRRPGDAVGLLETTVASLAEISVVQVATDVVRWLKIRVVVDG